jgi:hypothetical protein
MSEDLIISNDDILKIRPQTFLPDEILDKVGDFWRKTVIPHDIDQTKFDSIYVTSDIHTDIYKLNSLLSGAGLIDSNGKEKRDDILKQINWLKPRTLLIIIGDLVDGSRDGFSEIPDPIGDIELILHIYLFNLRIRAQVMGSDIRFTLGNHDYHSVILENSQGFPHFYDSWVHNSAKQFFGSRAIRRASLLPFYLCQPYIFLRVGTELAFVHGGLHTENNGVKNMAIKVLQMQKKIDKAGDFALLSSEDHAGLSFLGANQKEGGPLWSRFYSYGNPKEVCEAVGDPFKMVIVGHCQTDTCNKGDNMADILKNPLFKDCDGGGCVLLGCDKKDKGPSLSFVDISLSSAFRNLVATPDLLNLEENEKKRRSELLKFEHDPLLDITERYYNRITREKVGGIGVNETLIHWQAQKKGTGGKRKSKTHKKLNKNQNKKQNRKTYSNK